MAKGDNYSNLEITIDTREKDTIYNQKKNMTRMKIVTDFFESLGAIVDRSKVEYCDYAIYGTFYRNEEPLDINLGIQYKTLNGDFFPSLPKLPEVLFRAHSEFKDVALVVEENGHDIKLNDDHTDGMFQNYLMQSSCEKTGTGLYSAYKNFMQSMSECKVQARSIRSNEHFPMEIVSILKYISKPYHDGLYIRPAGYYEELSNSFSRFPGIGAKGIGKLLEYVPNLRSLCDMSMEELRIVLGPLQAKKLYAFLNNNERKPVTFENWQSYYAAKKAEVADPYTMIKTKARTSDEVEIQFGYSKERTLEVLMGLKLEGKIYYDGRSRLWKQVVPSDDCRKHVDDEMDVGV